jgi:hypothetical protein
MDYQEGFVEQPVRADKRELGVDPIAVEDKRDSSRSCFLRTCTARKNNSRDNLSMIAIARFMNLLAIFSSRMSI